MDLGVLSHGFYNVAIPICLIGSRRQKTRLEERQVLGLFLSSETSEYLYTTYKLKSTKS